MLSLSELFLLAFYKFTYVDYKLVTLVAQRWDLDLHTPKLEFEFFEMNFLQDAVIELRLLHEQLLCYNSYCHYWTKKFEDGDICTKSGVMESWTEAQFS